MIFFFMVGESRSGTEGTEAMVFQVTLHCAFSERCHCGTSDARRELNAPLMPQGHGPVAALLFFRVPNVS